MLAVYLAVAALLPVGPRYAGFSPFSYVDIVVLGLLGIWGWARLKPARRLAPRLPSIPAWPLTVAAALGAMVFALMAEHRLGSPVFRATLRDVGDLFWPLSHATHPLYALRVALTFVEGWVVFVILADLCRRAPDPARRARALLGGWLAGFACVSAFAIFQNVTRFQLHPYWVRANPYIVRSHATLEDPNALGAYMVLGIGLLVGLLYLEERRRRWWLPLLLLGTVGLMTTVSRAAIGAVVLAPFGVLAFVPNPVTRLQRALRLCGRIMVASVVVVVVASAAARLFVSERTRTLPTNTAELIIATLDPRESLDWVMRGRLSWWDASFDMFRERPWTGVGLGRVPRLMTTYGGGKERENTHNIYLQMFAETGVPGGVAFLALVAGLCAALARRLTSAPTPYARAIALGGLIGVVGFLLTMLTGHALLLPSGQVLFAAFAAAVLGVSWWHSSATEPTAPVQGPRRATGRLAVACVAVIAWYPVIAWTGPSSRPGGAWGYAWGLHGHEQTGGGAAYRWTKGRALLELDVPADASALELPVAAPSPIRDGKPVRLRVTAAGQTQELTLDNPDIHKVVITLGDAHRSAGRLRVDIHVDAPFVPAHVDPQSRDTRELGVQLLRPRFLTRGELSSK